jgi:hypothetical protein
VHDDGVVRLVQQWFESEQEALEAKDPARQERVERVFVKLDTGEEQAEHS